MLNVLLYTVYYIIHWLVGKYSTDPSANILNNSISILQHLLYSTEHVAGQEII